MRRPSRAGKGTRRGTGRRPEALTGKISRTQLVSTFGIGSLYEMRIYRGSSQWVTSVTIAGLDEWETCLNDFQEIREPVLEHVLKVGFFVEPPEASDDFGREPPRCPTVPVFRFPRWLVCSKCGRLGGTWSEFSDMKSGMPKCNASECVGYGAPVRLVATCYGEDEQSGEAREHPGHIDDFPWHWWAHSDRENWSCDGRIPQLKLVSSGQSAGLAGLRVECHHPECRRAGIGRSLEGVFARWALQGRQCRGRRPWLDDHEECDRQVRVLMRGASNVYFPVVASALSIPPNSTACKNEVGRIWRKSLKPVLAAQPELAENLNVLISTVRNASPLLRRHYTDQQVGDAILEQLQPDRGSTELPENEAAQRALERIAIVEERSDCDEQEISCLFQAERVPDEELSISAPDLGPLTENLVLVHRLREVRALRGFQRLAPGISGDSYTTPCAPLAKERKSWLPAITVQGEGVYFELKPELVRDWADRESVSKRFSVFEQRYTTWCRNKGAQPDHKVLSPAFVLVHTLAHLLINQLSLDCGYSSASLRERIYVQHQEGDQDWYGFMIYTATTSADGTLGGLVRQGEPDLFSRTFEAAIANATWCSSDPLCIESSGQGADALNRAACHACCIVSETSCEFRNLFLDRGLVVGTPDEPDAGFFYETSFIEFQNH